MGKYGKSALNCDIALPNFDGYLQKIKDAGNNIDEACKKAINASLPIIEDEMKRGAERHKNKGEVLNAIESTEAKVEGNWIYGAAGINTDKHPEALHAIYEEYGDGHSPEFPDPFIRPAYDNNKSKIKKIQRDVLKKEGVPIE